ncbi:hypothetical protein ABKV19_007288 [Rosa sericea]
MSGVWPTFCSTTPHFFKIILENTSRDIKLKIPKKFVKRYGEHLSNSVCLKIPSGCEWEVGVTRSGNKVWFEKGWPAFSKFYSLDYGAFLLFGYEGNSKFQVCIFDTSATEIAYPIHIEESDNINCEDDNSVEVLDDFPHCCPKTREKSPLPSPRPQKRRRMSSNSKENFQGKNDIIGKEYGGGLSSTQSFRKGTHKVCGRMHSSTANAKTIALERANGFKSEKPFSVVTIHPSYLHYNTLNVRASFVKSFATQEQQLVKLQVGDRSWPVKLNIYDKYSTAKFSAGWHAFSNDNCLTDGDVCIFELIQMNDIVLKVHIFRSVD